MLNWFQRNFGITALIDEAFAPVEEPTPASPTVGDILHNLGLRVVHFRAEPDEYGLGLRSARNTTVVYKPRQDDRHTIEVSTAVCSERDPFDRKHGTQLALQRFLSGQTVHLPPMQAPQTDYELLSDFFA